MALLRLCSRNVATKFLSIKGLKFLCLKAFQSGSVPVESLRLMINKFNRTRFSTKIIAVTTTIKLLAGLSTTFHPVPKIPCNQESVTNNLSLDSYNSEKNLIKLKIKYLNLENPNFSTYRLSAKLLFLLTYILGLLLLYLLYISYQKKLYQFFKFQFFGFGTLNMEQKKESYSDRIKALIGLGGGPRRPPNWWERFKKEWERKLRKAKRKAKRAKHIIDTYWAYKEMKRKWLKRKQLLKYYIFMNEKVWENLFSDPRDV